jgi:hypothetical protein
MTMLAATLCLSSDPEDLLSSDEAHTKPDAVVARSIPPQGSCCLKDVSDDVMALGRQLRIKPNA